MRPVVLNDGGDHRSTTFSLRGKSFTMQEQPSSHNHGLVVWDSAKAILEYFDFNPRVLSSLHGKRILELGSGTGLVGIALSNIVGAEVTLTDLPSVLSSLKANAASNMPDPSDGGSLRVLSLPWGDAEAEAAVFAESGPFDFIIGTDVAYSKTLNPSLIKCAAKMASLSEEKKGKAALGSAAAGSGSSSNASSSSASSSSARCVVFFANEMRCEEAQAVFDSASEAAFAVTRIPEKQLPPDWRKMNLRIHKMVVKKGWLLTRCVVGGGVESGGNDAAGDGALAGEIVVEEEGEGEDG